MTEPRTVLLVDDSVTDATIITARLRDAAEPAVEVLHVLSLGEALAVLDDRVVDVVLLDLGLPDTTGIDGLERLREDHEVPVVVLTGHHESDYGTAALRAGAQDFLSKDGADAPSLMRAIRYAEERHAHGVTVERAQRRLQRYARAIAHDIRTPLTSIRGFAELITVEEEVRGDTGSRSAEYAAAISAAARRLATMVEELLVDAEATGEEVPVDLTAAARWAVEVLGDELDARGAQVTILYLPVVDGYRSSLRQAFVNLIGNSLAHADASPLRVHVHAQQAADGGWSVVVEDNGTSVRPAVLMAGARVPQEGLEATADGHGLGLRTLALVMQEHGGRVDLERSAAGGLRTTLVFPKGASR